MPALRPACAFTLIELLVVIGIIAVLAALTVPALNHFKRADATLSATRQLLDDVDRARQLAISRRTTVYMIFCPSNFWTDPMRSAGAEKWSPLPSTEKDKRTNLFDKQLTGYTFVTLRNVGEQPGRLSPRYLTPWRTLPENAFIPINKFNLRPNQWYPIYDKNDPTGNRLFKVYGFAITNGIPFPSEDAFNPSQPNGYVTVPYIAFNYLGQLISGQDEYIPVAKGSVLYARDPATKQPLEQPPNAAEQPAGNSTNAYNIIHIDWVSGRARLEHQEISG